MSRAEDLEETIVGVATGAPDGGVAIVRLSGSRAVAIAEALAGELPPPRRLELRRIRLGSVREAVEEALVVFMPGPNSFTGEDVVELQVHGGRRNVDAIVHALLEAGAVAAGAGDFSRRAFTHGRQSLDQLEGMAALIGARSQAALDQARRLIAGELGEEVDAVRGVIELLRMEMEAHLDFPEDVGVEDRARWRGVLFEQRDSVRGWLQRFEAGRRAREGARVVLAGPTNAGKSALFNALLGSERTLVSAEAGTTRDYVEAVLEIGGRQVTLVDTAGLREGVEVGEVEGAGIARANLQVAGADLVLWIEAADAVDEAAVPRSGTRLIRIESKRDLGRRRGDWLGVSAVRMEGLEAIENEIRAWFGEEDEAWIGLARHRARAHEGLAAFERALELLDRDAETELVCFELQIGEGRLAEICARHRMGAVGRDVLDGIFSRFCIGK